MGFGLLQAVSNLGYWVVAVVPGNMPIMATAVGLENLCGGLGTTAFGALLLALCAPQFSATQFALLSALASIGRVYLAGPLTPVLVESFGWATFFLITVVIALPGLILLRWHRRDIERLG
jgi:PAT family beta-lactamase induction signal transducer AmpG